MYISIIIYTHIPFFLGQNLLFFLPKKKVFVFVFFLRGQHTTRGARSMRKSIDGLALAWVVPFVLSTLTMCVGYVYKDSFVAASQMLICVAAAGMTTTPPPALAAASTAARYAGLIWLPSTTP